MIVVFHNNKKVQRVVSHDLLNVTFSKTASIASVLLELANAYPKEKIVWCHNAYETHLNTDFIVNSQTSLNTVSSYDPNGNYFPDTIGYVESSPFISIKRNVSYPTWQMSGAVGYAHASVFVQI